MRFTKTIAGAAAGLALAGAVGLATPAGAAGSTARHTLTLSGSTYITDDETFSDEHCTRTFSDFDNAQLPSDPAADVDDTDNRCGGEIRVEVHVSTILKSNGDLCVTTGRVLLFEGTSESTNDLDGRETFSGCVTDGTSRTWRGTVHNTDEGGDKASFTINLTNSR